MTSLICDGIMRTGLYPLVLQQYEISISGGVHHDDSAFLCRNMPFTHLVSLSDWQRRMSLHKSGWMAM